MNSRIIDVLNDIKDQYGDMVFYNHHKTRNLMNDIAPTLHRERLHICQFLEINGYFQLKYAEHSYPIIRKRLINNYSSTYDVNESAAEWVVDVFSELLNLSDFKNLGSMVKKPESISIPKHEPVSKADKSKPAPEIQHSRVPAAIRKKNTAAASTVLSHSFDMKKRISADMHSVAVMPDGTVAAAGPNYDGQCNVGRWRDIVAVSCGPFFTVGLKANGRVVACGRNSHGQCNTWQWDDVVEISAGARHTVALKSDGTVVAAGHNRNGECNVSGWRNIKHVSAGYMCTFGIKKDNKVLCKGNADQTSLDKMANIEDIINPYLFRSLVLKKNGRLTILGRDESLKKIVSKWSSVTQISAGPDYFAGLMKNGTVRTLAYYWISNGVECNPDGWTDITAIAAGRFHLLGVKNDGSIVSAMMHPNKAMDKGQCRVGNWMML